MLKLKKFQIFTSTSYCLCTFTNYGTLLIPIVLTVELRRSNYLYWMLHRVYLIKTPNFDSKFNFLLSHFSAIFLP